MSCIRNIITYAAVVVTGFALCNLTLGIAPLGGFTDLSRKFTYVSPHRGTILFNPKRDHSAAALMTSWVVTPNCLATSFDV